MTVRDPKEPILSPGERRRDAPLDVTVPADPALQNISSSSGRMAIYAAAVVVLLGAAFYGLSSSPPTTATVPPATTAADNGNSVTLPSPPIRNVTPNRESGTTTGAAPAR